MLVHLTVSPTLIEIGFGLNAKLTIEFVTVFGACGCVVVFVIVVVVVVAGGGVAVAGGVVMVVDSGVVVGLPTAPVVLVVATEMDVVVDEGLTVPTVVCSAVVVELAGLVVLVGAEPESEAHAARTIEAPNTAPSHLRNTVPLVKQHSLGSKDRTKRGAALPLAYMRCRVQPRT